MDHKFTLRQFADGSLAQAWLPTAHGAERIRYVRGNWWVVCGSDPFTRSYCCGPMDTVFATEAACLNHMRQHPTRFGNGW